MLGFTLPIAAYGVGSLPRLAQEKTDKEKSKKLGEVDELLSEGVVAFGPRDDAESQKQFQQIIEKLIKKKPQPAYSSTAKAVRAQGVVAVKVMVDESGKVIAAQVEGGHPLLRAETLLAARKLELEPLTVEGKPVKVVGYVLYNFTLSIR